MPCPSSWMMRIFPSRRWGLGSHPTPAESSSAALERCLGPTLEARLFCKQSSTSQLCTVTRWPAVLRQTFAAASEEDMSGLLGFKTHPCRIAYWIMCSGCGHIFGFPRHNFLIGWTAAVWSTEMAAAHVVLPIAFCCLALRLSVWCRPRACTLMSSAS